MTWKVWGPIIALGLTAPAMWGCKPHWFKLPATLRNKIWAAYRPGQEISKTPSRDYVRLAREVQDWIARNHGATS